MQTRAELRGVVVAVVTPFTEEGKLDEVSLKRITAYLLGRGVHGIMTTGGTGEGPHLLREERKAVTQIVVETVKGQIPVIAGTAACSTMETILLTKDTVEVTKHMKPKSFRLCSYYFSNHSFHKVWLPTRFKIVLG